jgi:hypothetical protein
MIFVSLLSYPFSYGVHDFHPGGKSESIKLGSMPRRRHSISYRDIFIGLDNSQLNFHSPNIFNVLSPCVVRITLLCLPLYSTSTSGLSNPPATLIGFSKPLSLLCLAAPDLPAEPLNAFGELLELVEQLLLVLLTLVEELGVRAVGNYCCNYTLHRHLPCLNSMSFSGSKRLGVIISIVSSLPQILHLSRT